MSELDELIALAREDAPPPLDDARIDETVTHAAVTGRSRHRAWVRRRMLLSAGIGAALAAAAVLIFWVPIASAPPAPTIARPRAPAPAETPPRTDLELSTGDRLLADQGAHFRVELATARERRIRLDHGSMLFDVRALDDGRFTVNTPTAQIVVLGTVFTVTTQPGGTTVRVYEGRVEVRDRGAVRQIGAGEHARVGDAPEAADPLATAARRAVRLRRPAPTPSSAPPAPTHAEPLSPPTTSTSPPPGPPVSRRSPRAGPRPRAPSTAPSAEQVRRWIARGSAHVALIAARRHVDAGGIDPWLLLEADALRALRRRDEAADAYARAAERLPSPRAEQAGFASARLQRHPERALAALDRGGVLRPESPLRERGLALRVDLLGRLGRTAEQRATAREYLNSYPQGSRVPTMRALVGQALDP